MRDGRRIGLIFRCPNAERRKWWLTCFAEPTRHAGQHEAVKAIIGDWPNWLPCNEIAWSINGGIENATFESLTVTPSIDAGESLWHGYITNGEIR